MARLLHALTGPTQILTQTRTADLRPVIQGLTKQIPKLPHPALRAAAGDHAAFLTELDARGEVLARRVLVVFRQPARMAARSEATVVLRRQAQDAAAVLAGAGISLTPLTRGQASQVLGLAAPAPLPDTPGLPADEHNPPVTATPSVRRRTP
jgi:hypothetical protein